MFIGIYIFFYLEQSIKRIYHSYAEFLAVSILCSIFFTETVTGL